MGLKDVIAFVSLLSLGAIRAPPKRYDMVEAIVLLVLLLGLFFFKLKYG